MTAKVRVYHRTGLGHRFGTKYHRQDDADDCGRACAQALLRTIENHLYTQSELDDALGTNCLGSSGDNYAQLWGTYPSCMEERIRLVAKRKGVKRDLQLIAFMSAADASQCIARSIILDGIPTAVVANSGGHWILVYGCDFDNNPDKPGENSEISEAHEFVNCRQTPYKIRAFYVHDPAAAPWRMDGAQIAATTAPSSAHSDTDNCGQGMIPSLDAQGNPLEVDGEEVYEAWGLAYRRIRYGYWKEIVFTNIPDITEVPDLWANRHLALVDVTRIPDLTVYTGCEEQDEPEDSVICHGATIPVWATDQTKFTEEIRERVRRVTRQGLQEDGLLPIVGKEYEVNNTSNSWKKAWRDLLRNTEPDTVYAIAPENPTGPPDEGAGFYYYLVELKKETSGNEDKVPAVVLVSGCRNKEKVLEMAAVAEGGIAAIKLASSEDQIRAIRQMKVVPDSNLRLHAIPGVTISSAGEAPLVWQLKPGNLSPYAPSRRIVVEYKPEPDAEPTQTQILLPATVSQWQQHLSNLDVTQLQLRLDHNSPENDQGGEPRQV